MGLDVGKHSSIVLIWDDCLIDKRSPWATVLMMRIIRKTEVFGKWLNGLKDIRARARVLVRIQRLEEGNPGDVKSVGSGVSEMRINYGPGYRVYFCERGREIVILLAGGTKRTQSTDIKRAIALKRNLEEHS